ncbi:MAG TPA: hypothetical protein VI893_04365, partial [Thermoplasmata archaeon]|nr:hypothetical protein [Thermoplasmata archaeon]
LSFYLRSGDATGSPACDTPDANDLIWVEWSIDGAVWNCLKAWDPDGVVACAGGSANNVPSSAWQQSVLALPGGALQSGFRIRFQTTGSGITDDYGIDDVLLTASTVGLIRDYDIDYTNPVTTLTGPPDGWFDANFAATVTDSDATSGLQTCYYTVDDLGRAGVEIDSATRACSTGFTVTVGATATCRTEGADLCRVTVWSSDNAGNLATGQTRDYDIDFNAPTSSLSPPDGWKNADFAASVNDDNGGTGSPLDTCHYIIDDLGRAGVELDTTRACDGGFNVPVGTTPDICQTEGANKCHVEVWAVDLAGTEGIHNFIDYDIDFSAPTSTLSPPDGWYKTDIIFTVNDDDPYSGLATCYYEVDDLGRAGIEESGVRVCDGGSTVLVGPGAFHCQTEGLDKCRVKVWATDNLGQISTGTTRDYNIDYTGPTSTITGPPDTPKGADFLVNTSDVDALSGLATCTHRINDLGRAGIEEEAAHTCNTNFTVTVSEAAIHCQTNGADACEVRVWSTDAAGNVGPAFIRLYDIDNTKPTSIILTPPVAYKGVDFQVTVDDDPNGGSALTDCYYSIDDLGRAGGPEVNTTRSCPDGSFNVTVGTSPDVCRTEGSDMCRVRVWARNAAGAVGAGTTWTYHIDLTLPIVTFNNPPAGSGNGLDFVIDISDSDPAPGSLFNTTYMVKSLGVQTRGWTPRNPNSANSATITVGANKDCRDVGSNTCEVIVSAYDAAGNQRLVSRLFSVPVFGAPPATPSLLHPFDMQRGGPGGTSLPIRFNTSDPDNSRIRYQVQIDKFDDMSGTETVMLTDSFEGGTVDTAKWATNTGPAVQNSDCTASSGTNSLEMDGTDTITSVTLNLSRAVTGKVEFNFYTGGGGACPTTGSGFDHFTEYLK